MAKTRVSLEAVRGSTYWSEAEGRAAVEAFEASGLSLAAFARAQGLSAPRIRWWRAREAAGARGLPRLLPVDLAVGVVSAVAASPAPTGDSGDAGLEIRLRGGRRIHVGSTFDEASLARVVVLLESLPC